ncbi:MAG: hypothetical protein MJ171_05415 [Clostridia bacterium]|nr:hypothetical protein [Clostridia bacterium]
MKKIKFIAVLILITALLFATACGSNNDNKPADSDPQNGNQQTVDEHYADEDFIKDFVSALCARWDYKSDYQYESGTQDHFNYFTELVQIERDYLAKYRTETFKNPALGKLANDYLDGLDQQDKSLSYLIGSYDTYRSLWSEARDKRAICIKTIYDEISGFEVPAKYDDILHHMLTAANVSLNSDAVSKMLNAPIASGDYKLDKSSLTVSVTNTVGFEFRDFVIYSDLYNGSNYVYYGDVRIDSWKPGDVYEFVFNLDPNVKFDRIEITTE